MKVPPLTRHLSHLRRIADERGIALITALFLMISLSIVTTSVLYFSTETFHASSRTDADQEAYALAEAGINTAIAKIYGASDPRTTTILHAGTHADPATVVPKCSSGTNSSETPDCYQTGSVTYSGSLNTSGGNTWYWNISSTGSVPVSNVTTATRTLTRAVGVTGNNGTNGNSWSRFYQDSTSSCLVLNAVSVPTNFASKGCITLENGATVTGSGTNIQAGTTINIDPPETESPGSASSTGSGTTWSSASYAENSDNRYASVALNNNTTSYYLQLTNLGMDLPSTATINGISVAIEEKASSNSSSNYIVDNNVQLLKGGSATGNNKANTSTKWGTSDGTQTYGGATDKWGATLAGSDLDASNFGVQLQVKGVCSSCKVTAYVDSVTFTVYYTASSIGSSGTPISETDTGNGCQLGTNSVHSPCGTADHVWATTNNTVAQSQNANLSMPVIDWSYWYNNAEPGPKHFCTNSNPGITSGFFDNDTTMNGSISVNGEMAGNTAGPSSPYHEENWTHDSTTPNIDYDCEVWSIPPTGGQLLGEITWNHTTHVMHIYGTVYIDGSFRFDNDGEIVHYFGRGNLMSSKEDEIDAVVCAGGSGTDPTTSCLNNMSSWDPSQNMMVLMSNTAASWNAHDSDDYDEYDQGGTSCSGNTPPTCYDGHPAGGFQGILYSTGECLIHQDFEDSGPVICNSIDIPHETYDPDFFTFPSIGNLTDGMSFSDTASATDFTLNVSAQNG